MIRDISREVGAETNQRVIEMDESAFDALVTAVEIAYEDEESVVLPDDMREVADEVWRFFTGHAEPVS